MENIPGSIQSNAQLKFSYQRGTGRTVLSQRATGGLFHISKTYWDQGMLLTQLVNPTAGVFSGDEMHLRVELEPDTRVALVSPSASRFYAMHQTGAKLTQEIKLGKNSFLEYRPDYSIPHAHSMVDQHNQISLDKGARLFYIERFMPGRIATGEQFAFKQFCSTTKIFIEGKLVAFERVDLDPDAGGWPLKVPDWENTFSATIWIAGAQSESVMPELEKFEAKAGDSLFCGISQLESELFVVRILAPQSIVLKKAIVDLRSFVAKEFQELADSSRILLSNHT